MSIKIFEDPQGKRWQVWPVVPGRPVDFQSHLHPSLANGWLTFESIKGEKRRLAPIPPGWMDKSSADLWALCQIATPVIKKEDDTKREDDDRIEDEALVDPVNYPSLAELKQAVGHLGLDDERIALVADLDSIPPALVADLLGALDALHRSWGGAGLRLESEYLGSTTTVRAAI